MAAASDSSLDTSLELTAQQQRNLLAMALGAVLWQVGTNSSVSYFKHELVLCFCPAVCAVYCGLLLVGHIISILHAVHHCWLYFAAAADNLFRAATHALRQSHSIVCIV